MPYLQITGPKLTLQQKKAITKDITDIVLHASQLPPEAREWTTIHFTPFELEDIAIGVQLLSEKPDKTADYHIAIHERNLDETKKRRLVDELTPAFARLLGLDTDREEDLAKINIMIIE